MCMACSKDRKQCKPLGIRASAKCLKCHVDVISVYKQHARGFFLFMFAAQRTRLH
uniref:Uncharacterized protein n=2 Tax=Anguilla anguilla TaxID=7936 RepID=A0A0E9UHC0_ANGAN